MKCSYRETLLQLLCFCIGVVTSLDVDIALEHNLSGSFNTAGRIEGVLPIVDGKTTSRTAKLTLTWNEFSPEEISHLHDLSSKNKLYTLRIQAQQVPGSPKVNAVMFSMPAACFAANLHGPHRLDLHLSPAGWLTGLEVRYQPDQECVVPDQVVFPTMTFVKALFPTPGVSLQSEQVDDAAQAKFMQAQDTAYKAMLQEDPTLMGKRPEGQQAPKKEKTFLEQNWLIIAAGGMLLLNLLATGHPLPPPGSGTAMPTGGAPAPTVAAAAPTRRVAGNGRR